MIVSWPQFLRACLPSMDVSRLCDLVWLATNAERSRHRLRPLHRHVLLDGVASGHSRDMAVRGYFDHRDPEGRGVEDRIARSCPELAIRSSGENLGRVAALAGPQLLAAKIVKLWMDSPGHRANILDPEWSHLGVGVYLHTGYVFATQVFVNLVAELVGAAPRSLRRGRTEWFRFRLHGSYGRTGDLSVIVRVPDERLRIEHGGGYYAWGWYPVGFGWERDLLVVPFTARHGAGTYQVCLANPSTGKFIPLLRVQAA